MMKRSLWFSWAAKKCTCKLFISAHGSSFWQWSPRRLRSVRIQWTRFLWGEILIFWSPDYRIIWIRFWVYFYLSWWSFNGKIWCNLTWFGSYKPVTDANRLLLTGCSLCATVSFLSAAHAPTSRDQMSFLRLAVAILSLTSVICRIEDNSRSKPSPSLPS